MKTLHDHIIVYDQDCPLCRSYTGAFIKTGMLEENGRVSFNEFIADQHSQLDMARSRDEIALINKRTGDVTYGLDSLLKILENSIPLLKPLFRLKWFRFSMQKLYLLVSYNRKVISPASQFESPTSCTPSFNLTYRWVYILLSWVFTSVVLSSFTTRLVPLIPASTFLREWLICGGQIIFQSLVFAVTRERRLLHYLGNLMTVSNIGSLLLLPSLFLRLANPLFFAAWFVCVVAFMLFEHYRRTKILELPVWISATWILYRLLILFILL